MDQKQKWMDGVNRARELFSMRRKNQMEIARIACEVCVITRGGASHKQFFTLKRFAKESGISAKTLSNWIFVYKSIFVKIPVAIREKASYTQLESSARQVRPEHTESQVRTIVNAVINRNDLDGKMLRYLGDFSAFYANLCSDKIWSINIHVLEEAMYYASLVHNKLRSLSRIKKINAINHNLITKFQKHGLSAKKAFALDASHARSEVGDIKLNSRDKTAYAFLSDRAHRKFTPTDLGLAIFTEGTKSARKQRALRCLEKFITLDLAKKNENGEYWAVRR